MLKLISSGNKTLLIVSILFSLSACNYFVKPKSTINGSGASRTSLTASKPNIIYILADDQGWRDLGFNGAPYYETPAIDRLAAGGMVFNQAYSSGPNCAPSRASLISGMYPPRHLIYQPGGAAKGDPRLMELMVPLANNRIKRYGLQQKNIPFEARTTLSSETVSIAEVLKTAGYTTARFGKWHLGADNQGFDVNSYGATKRPIDIANERKFYRDDDVARRLTDASVGFIEAHQDKPFFLYLSHYDVHLPLAAGQQLVDYYQQKKQQQPEKYQGYNPIYAAMNHTVDNSVARIIDTLERLNLSENTLIIYSSDNGAINSVSANKPLRAGKGSLYEGGIRVPFVAYWPDTIKANTRTEQAISSVDMLPTLAALAGADLPKNQAIDGVSLTPILQGKAIADRAIFWHYPMYLDGEDADNYIPFADGRIGVGKGWRAKPASAVRWQQWKLIEYFEGSQIELYNLAEDIGEANNVANLYPAIANDLHKRLQQWRADTQAVVPKRGVAYMPIAGKR